MRNLLPQDNPYREERFIMKKRVLAIVMALAMVLSTAGAVFADDTAALKPLDQGTAALADEAGAQSETAGEVADADAASLATADDGVTLDEVKAKSFRVYWNVPTLAAGQTFTKYIIKDNNENIVYDSATQAGATINNNAAVFTTNGFVKDTFWVYCYYSDSYGGGYKYLGYTRVNTLPVQVNKSKICIYSFYNGSSPCVYMKHTYASIKPDGVQFQVRKYDGTLVYTKKASTSTYFNLKTNAGFKYRARFYYKNYNNGVTYFGPWSGYKFFDNPTVSGTAYNSKKIKITLKKATGVKSFKIYISGTNSNYSLAKTVKVTSKTSYTTYLTKCKGSSLKRGKKYYFKIVPIMKNGVQSEIKPIYYVTIP